MAFRENLKSELEFKNMKVKELSEKTGISRRTIDQYLSAAAKMPSAENAVKIAQALGVSVEYLVTGKPSAVSDADIAREIQLFQKYRPLIAKMETLPKNAWTFSWTRWVSRGDGAKVEFLQCNGRNERKRGSAHENTLPPRSGTAVSMCRFPLGACFDNYAMHELNFRQRKIKGKRLCPRRASSCS